VLWKGAVGPLLTDQGQSSSVVFSCLVAGLFSLTAACLVLCRLSRDIAARPPPTDDDDDDAEDAEDGGSAEFPQRDSRLEITAHEAASHASDCNGSPKRNFRKKTFLRKNDLFRAPGVPFVPGAAIFLNFLLMAQYAWLDHLYLLALYGTAYAGYACAKCEPDKRLDSPTTASDHDDDLRGDGGGLDRPLLGS